MIVYRNSSGQYHRVSGPALEWSNGTKKYFINRLRHRVNGPAIEWADGEREFWENGRRISYKSETENDYR